MKKLTLFLSLISLLNYAQTIRYVTPTGAGAQNGTSWANAAPSSSLQLMIIASSSVTADQVWVAAGTYKPTHDPFGSTSPADLRDRTFYLTSGTKLYGGFNGTETLLSQANSTLNITTLSGDFSGNDNYTGSGATLTITIANVSENAYHTLLSVNDGIATVLNGFTIKGAAATGTGSITFKAKTINRNIGGGLYLNNSSMQITNCNIINNITATSGGGIYNVVSNVTSLINCNVSLNLSQPCSCSGSGIGVYTYSCVSVNVSGCVFNGNCYAGTGTGYGIGNCSEYTSSNITNCRFNNNAQKNASPIVFGSALLSSNSAIILTNSVFAGNGLFTGPLGGGLSLTGANTSTVSNCVFFNNTSYNGGAIYSSHNGAVSFFNNTIFSNNASSISGGIFLGSTGTNNFYNNTIWGNTGTTSDINIAPSVFANNTTEFFTGGTSTSTLNPLFTNTLSPVGVDGVWFTSDDGLQLNCSSPCVNTGTNTISTTLDVLGVPRPQGSGVDRGAYERRFFTLSPGTQTNVLCNGASTGIANIIATGGIGSPIYTWLPSGGSGASASNLSAGNYTVSVSNASVCSASQNFFITEPTAISSSTAASNIVCNGANTGLAAVIVSGGIPSYSYSWSPNGGTNSIASGLTAGIYTCTVTDANNCSLVKVFSITQPNAFIVTAVANNTAICSGQSSTLTASASGGTGTITYTWTAGPTNSINVVSPASSTIYTVNISDVNNCSKSQTLSLTVNALPTINVNSGAICTGNSFTITPSGASTYTYSNGSNIASPIVNTTYTVNGTDVNGCVGNTVSSVTVNALPNVTVNSSTVCAGQTDLLIANGANTYTWSTAATTSSVFVTPTTNTMYVVTGTDANGCTNSATATAVVNATPTVTAVSTNTLICIGQSVIITPSGAVNYNITGGTFTVSPTATTNYTVNGIASNGCMGNVVITQSVSTCTDIWSLNNTDVQIVLHPNPNHGAFDIELNTDAYVIITNSIGQAFFNGAFNFGKHHINLGDAVNGIYFIKVITLNAETTKRLVISK